MIQDLQRLMGKLRKPPPATPVAPRSAGPVELQRMRNALLEAVSDCRDVVALRLQAQIVRAHSARELWHLRAPAHDLIARHHCQTVAAERIQRLDPLAQGSRL